MAQSNYVDLLLAKSDTGELNIFLVPTSKAREGDLLLVDETMYTVIDSEWIGVDSKTHRILQAAGTFFIPDKILSVRWEREELQDANNEENSDNS